MCPTATIQQKLHAVQDILGRRQARSQSARAAELFEDSAELAHAQQLDAEQYSALEAQQDPEGTDDPSPDASELLIDMPPHSIAGIGWPGICSLQSAYRGIRMGLRSPLKVLCPHATLLPRN